MVTLSSMRRVVDMVYVMPGLGKETAMERQGLASHERGGRSGIGGGRRAGGAATDAHPAAPRAFQVLEAENGLDALSLLRRGGGYRLDAATIPGVRN
jgi:hypothetical protein